MIYRVPKSQKRLISTWNTFWVTRSVFYAKRKDLLGHKLHGLKTALNFIIMDFFR